MTRSDEIAEQLDEMPVRPLQELVELKKEGHSLTLSLESDLLDYFKTEMPAEQPNGEPETLERFISICLRTELADESYQKLRTSVESANFMAYSLRSNMGYIWKLLLLNLANADEGTITEWIGKHVACRGKKPGRPYLGVYGEPPPRPERIQRLVRDGDTKEITFDIKGDVHADLADFAHERDMSIEEVAETVLHNYRSNADLRDLRFQQCCAMQEFNDIIDDFVDAAETVLCKTTEASAVEFREWMDGLREKIKPR